MKIARLFLYSAGALLLLTAAAKLVSSFGSTRILQMSDPVLALPFRYVFWLVSAIELGVAFACFFGKRVGLQAGLVAWLSTNFVVYRLGLLCVGYHKPCSCLGNLTDALHIPPQTADTAMKIILGYLLFGSYATLFWLWKQKRKASPLMPPTEATASLEKEGVE